MGQLAVVFKDILTMVLHYVPVRYNYIFISC